MTAALQVLQAGPLSTIQDRGRIGYQRYGVSVAGAADPLGLALANALVGNPSDMAAIEMTQIGDSYRIDAEAVRAGFAGDFAVSIDGEAAPADTTLHLRHGQVLKIGAARSGSRGYLAVAGGFDLPPVLGSLSTHTRSGLGGLGGRRLAPGDALPLRLAQIDDGPVWRIDPAARPTPDARLRALPGPQDDYFSADALAGFFDATYQIGREADRMGYRLSGPPIAHARGFNIVSDAIPLGAIQIPGNGQPIVMLADRQTTGGYPKIAVLLSPDVAALAQRRPGDAVRFQAVDRATAGRIARDWAMRLADPAAWLVRAGHERWRDSAFLLAQNLIGGAIAGDAFEEETGP